jgi:hypothetical protein
VFAAAAAAVVVVVIVIIIVVLSLFRLAPSLTPSYCNQVQITNLRILNPFDAPNTDGIDPDSSTNVLIDSCYITCGTFCAKRD